jgi:hypothetical protein
MKPLRQMPRSQRRRIRAVLTDIDDTLTDGGRLTAVAYGAMERLQRAGLLVVPVTGRPAGWCDLIARQWPVDGVVGENGALYFRYDRRRLRMRRRFALAEKQRAEAVRRLARLGERIVAKFRGAAISADQAFRAFDLAIDFREDVRPLSHDVAEQIAEMARRAGAVAKVSSIHVNIWYGRWDKLSMSRRLLGEAFGLDAATIRAETVYVGDSPNDAPMFGYFPNAVGVANVRDFAGRMPADPAYVTKKRGGQGFAELADCLLDAR